MKCQRVIAMRLPFYLFLMLVSVTAFIALSQPAWCQQVTAAITGKVMDPSGAAIAAERAEAQAPARESPAVEAPAEGLLTGRATAARGRRRAAPPTVRAAPS